MKKLKLLGILFVTIYFHTWVQIKQPQFGLFQPIQPNQSYNTTPNYNRTPQSNPNNQYGSALQTKKAEQMIQYQQIKKELKNKTENYTPSPENNFNQLSPQMIIERDMAATLQEINRNNSAVISEA